MARHVADTNRPIPQRERPSMAVLPVRHFSCCRVTAMDPVRANAMSRVAGVATVVGIAMAALVMSGCAAKRPASSTPAPPAAPPTRYAATRSQVVDAAMKYVGAPYARGGASPAGFDCSGFVMFVYGRAGLRLPHGADKQYQLGLAVSRDALAPGDIVFFDGLRHSGIYIGDARFIHATKPGDVVKVSRLDEEWYRRRWVGARRLL